MTKHYDNDRRVFDVLTHEAGEAVADAGTSTRESRRFAREMRPIIRERIAELRRGLLPEAAPIEYGRPIRPELAAMERPSLIARLLDLTRAWGPQVQYAHRDLDTLSDDDLRRLVQRIEPSEGRK